MLEDKPSGQRDRILPPVVAETPSKPSTVPLQKHSLGGCSIDRAALHIVSLHDILLICSTAEVHSSLCVCQRRKLSV